ncbi:MAG: hypothetical protein MR433_09540, partial [Coriobacteriaceae bacterium]|nr:hypothetical protein [Coriobacteriaceae bacterium]
MAELGGVRSDPIKSDSHPSTNSHPSSTMRPDKATLEVDTMPLPKPRSFTAEDYWNLPEGVRAELIDGELYDMTPPNR